MSIEIKTPVLPESITDATVAVWHKSVGDWCQKGDVVVELETDKVMLEVTALESGQLIKKCAKEGDTVSGEVLIAVLDENATPETIQSKPKVEAVEEVSVYEPVSEPAEKVEEITEKTAVQPTDSAERMSPSERRRVYDGGPAPVKPDIAVKKPTVVDDGSFERQPMSRLRARIATRLVEATQETAMLTTFNEVNMDAIIAMRQAHQADFTAKHGVKLGFMSFFVQAVSKALETFPEVNASVDGNDILYHKSQHVGIAVSTERGLVVPVLKDAQNMSYAEIEQQIKSLAETARAGKMTLDQMQGGTFTITNGGVFGSMLSTPILNMPQSAILGMHAIQKRPVVIDDEITIASMMYLALSYDHRLIDGQQSVQFLVTIKQILEDPDRLLLDL